MAARVSRQFIVYSLRSLIVITVADVACVPDAALYYLYTRPSQILLEFFFEKIARAIDPGLNGPV